MQLEGKVAVITGAGSGIGKAAALLLAREGARVAALDLSKEDLESTVEEITRQDGEAVPYTVDVSDPGQTERAIDAAAGRFGRIDIVFANAGINGVWAPLEELKPEVDLTRFDGHPDNARWYARAWGCSWQNRKENLPASSS